MGRAAREERNTDHARRRREAKATTAAATANPGEAVAGAGAADQQGGARVVHNLNEAFLQVDGHEVQPTPSANLVVSMNELIRVLMSPEVAKATAVIKAATVQVVENHEN